ncbi:MAG: Holliday junction resolvase RuvX [Chitinophagaceae bacterium]|nr:MAG: Holliday junction resolvase YqgF [Bacteroidetes bacterium OLB11]MCC6448918.1 Holliday junction resolvase RuvX [Chitinophagaceae bacterium]HMN32543.1 Holliday junction resolvase RuvX [Chitinophagaceae bacterium]
MARILSIDYGKKRTGIAVTDPLQIIANGLTTVETHQLISFLKQYFQKEKVEKVIIGMPKSLKNEATDATPLVLQFIELFKKEFPKMLIIPVDERYTSKLAFRTVIDLGLKKKDRQDKARIDEISATILLQSFMESPSF